MEKEKLGKVLVRPTPQCIFCWEYTVKAKSWLSEVVGDNIWHFQCPKCHAVYEIDKVEEE